MGKLVIMTMLTLLVLAGIVTGTAQAAPVIKDVFVEASEKTDGSCCMIYLNIDIKSNITDNSRYRLFYYEGEIELYNSTFYGNFSHRGSSNYLREDNDLSLVRDIKVIILNESGMLVDRYSYYDRIWVFNSSIEPDIDIVGIEWTREEKGGILGFFKTEYFVQDFTIKNNGAYAFRGDISLERWGEKDLEQKNIILGPGQKITIRTPEKMEEIPLSLKYDITYSRNW